MNKLITVFLKLSAVYLWTVGVFHTINERSYFPNFKYDAIPYWFTILSILITAIPAIALFVVPNSINYRRIYKVLLAIVLAPPLYIFSGMAFHYFYDLFVYGVNFNGGLFYILSLGIGTISCLLGYYILLSKRFNENNKITP